MCIQWFLLNQTDLYCRNFFEQSDIEYWDRIWVLSTGLELNQSRAMPGIRTKLVSCIINYILGVHGYSWMTVNPQMPSQMLFIIIVFFLGTSCSSNFGVVNVLESVKSCLLWNWISNLKWYFMIMILYHNDIASSIACGIRCAEDFSLMIIVWC